MGREALDFARQKKIYLRTVHFRPRLQNSNRTEAKANMSLQVIIDFRVQLCLPIRPEHHATAPQENMESTLMIRLSGWKV